MLHTFTGLLLCQLAGEIISRAFSLPIPGPVMGLVLMGLILFATRGRFEPGEEFNATIDGLLARLGMLFVPAGVGAMQQLGVLGTYWLALLVTLVASTLITLVVTVGTFVAVKSMLAGAADG